MTSKQLPDQFRKFYLREDEQSQVEFSEDELDAFFEYIQTFDPDSEDHCALAGMFHKHWDPSAYTVEG